MINLREDSWIYILDDIVMIALAIVSVLLLLYEQTGGLSAAQIQLVDHTDLAIALIFLGEFFIKLVLAPKKIVYLKSNWWLLLASIPITTPATQALRALRLLRLFRLVRVVTGTDAILGYLERFFVKSYVIYVLVTFVLAILAGAAAFEFFEYGVNPNVHGYFDSIWWAVCTVTTDSYGDVIAVTTGGRIVAMILMTIGIGLAGVFTALVATFILGERQRN
jgi:voltage-gated potassium channel